MGVIKIMKTKKQDLQTVLSKKINPKDLDFVHEQLDNSIQFQMSDWSNYEQNFRRMLYEQNKFPKMGLLKEHTDFIFESFKKNMPLAIAVSNFKDDNIKKSKDIKKSTKNTVVEKSPFDKR